MKKREEQQRRRGRAGFTLIEILLVVVIIGMLATIVSVSVPKQLEKARVNKVRADIKGLGVAINAYYMDVGRYPASLGDLTSGEEPYLEGSIPKDPWGGEYTYSYPGSHKPYRYDLQATSPDGKTIANWNMDEAK